MAEAAFPTPIVFDLYIDAATNQAEHTPYRKALNHKEHIPWASHHPKDVKRGTYIGEMSRLATSSSKVEHYQEAITELYYLYVVRGYPPDLVKKWTKEHISKRWASQLNEPMRADGGVFCHGPYFSFSLLVSFPFPIFLFPSSL